MYRGKRLRLREWREASYLTQQELADKAGLSRQAIVNLEKPDTETEVRATNLRKLAGALDLSPDDLFQLPEEVKGSPG